MVLVRVLDATVEPVSLDEAKLQVRSDAGETSEDALITTFISAAREWVEGETQRALLEQTWRASFDAFPRPDYCAVSSIEYGYGSARAQQHQFDGVRIRLPMPNLLGVTSIKYIDVDGVERTLDPSTYVVDTDSLPGGVFPAYGTSWPATRLQPNAVRVLFRAGYGSEASTVPAAIKAAVLLGIEDLNRNRGAQTNELLKANDTVNRLLGRYLYREA